MAEVKFDRDALESAFVRMSEGKDGLLAYVNARLNETCEKAEKACSEMPNVLGFRFNTELKYGGAVGQYYDLAVKVNCMATDDALSLWCGREFSATVVEDAFLFPDNVGTLNNFLDTVDRKVLDSIKYGTLVSTLTVRAHKLNNYFEKKNECNYEKGRNTH